MDRYSEIEAQAMQLAAFERATLATRLVQSWSPELRDELDADAIRRAAEMAADPDPSSTLEGLKRAGGR